MRVLLIGGTRFIGRAILRRLVSGGHEVVVLHRGNHPLDPQLRGPRVREILANRSTLPLKVGDIGPIDAIVDTCAMSGSDTQPVVDAYAERGIGLTVVLSSIDVYQAFAAVYEARLTEAVPLFETSPLRHRRFLYRETSPEKADRDNLEVEAGYLAHPSLHPCLLRLPIVYGPHDYQRREWSWLRRVLDGRRVLPMPPAWIPWLCHRVYVEDVALSVELCLAAPQLSGGEIFNVGELDCLPWGMLAREVAAHAGGTLEVRPVDEELLPPHLQSGPYAPQPLLISTEKIRRVLGYRELRSRADDLAETVAWHIHHPPGPEEEGETPDYEAEQRLLEALDEGVA